MDIILIAYIHLLWVIEMRRAIAITKDSFSITGRGIILELEHHESGLPAGTVLHDSDGKRKWKVNSRVLFDHAVDAHRIFENESANYMLVRFKSDEKRESSIEQVRLKESSSVFQYLIEPQGHDEKPKNLEELEINYPQQPI